VFTFYKVLVIMFLIHHHSHTSPRTHTPTKHTHIHIESYLYGKHLYIILFQLQFDILTGDTICNQTDRQRSNECRSVDSSFVNSILVINLRFIPTKTLPGQVFETVFDELESEVLDLLVSFGCVVESKADIVVRGQGLQDTVDNITWYNTWEMLSKNTVEFVLYDIKLFVHNQETNFIFDNIMALFSGRLVRVLDKNSKTNAHDFLLQIEDKLNNFTVHMLIHSVFHVLSESLSTRERYMILGISHQNNDDDNKIVVNARSYLDSYACSYMPALEGVVNFMHLINCSLKNISKSDLNWTLLNNGSLSLLNGFIFSTDTFYYTSQSSIAVCNKSVQEYMLSMSRPIAVRHRKTPEGILSVVCLACSIVCLLVSLFVYLMLPKLRQTLPGLNTMVLVCFLLVSHTVFGIKSTLKPKGLSCKIIGLATHFSLLCSLFWMNVCTFHMFRVLTRVRIISTETATKRFIFYLTYTVVMSMVFVAVNISVTFGRQGTFGYGQEYCYIETQEMINFTVVLPAGIIVVLNCVFFFCVIVNLSKSRNIRKNVKTERNELTILVKLSTITGLTWIFGLVYSLTGEVAFSYLFIIFNASQGVFLFLAFIANRRVVDMLCTRLSCSTEGSSNVLTKGSTARDQACTQSTSATLCD